jgi:hypothetical protein
MCFLISYIGYEQGMNEILLCIIFLLFFKNIVTWWWVFVQFLSNVGVSDKWKMTDVYGLDDDLLATVPRPVLALLLLFPLNDKVYMNHYTC